FVVRGGGAHRPARRRSLLAARGARAAGEKAADDRRDAATFAWMEKSVFNLVLRPIRQLGINGRQRSWGRALFLRTFGVDARRWARCILAPPRRSFKLRVLINRQRPMKNVTLNRTTVLQLDADGTDGALDATADCDVLRNDAALDLCTIVDLEIRGAHL